jgi:hypothetical protein
MMKHKNQKNFFKKLLEKYNLTRKDKGLNANSNGFQFLTQMESKFGTDKLKEMISETAKDLRNTN